MCIESRLLNGMLVAAGEESSPLIMAVVVVVLVLFLIFSTTLMMIKYYKRCPSNRILVIYGKVAPGKPAVVVHGGAQLVMPLLQDYAWLSLEPMRLEVSSHHRGADRTLDFPVPRFFTAAIGTTPELMQNAAIRLLGLSFKEIEQFVDDIITAQLSKLIDTMIADGTGDDRETFYSQLDTMLEEELALKQANFSS